MSSSKFKMAPIFSKMADGAAGRGVPVPLDLQDGTVRDPLQTRQYRGGKSAARRPSGGWV